MKQTFHDIVANRYSCRHYSQEPISKEEVLEILECARLAPSACNRQPWKFMVITAPEELSAVHSSYNRDWIKEAPVAIIVLGNRNEAWHRSYDGYDATDIDIAITSEHICLAATSMGLGTCWICNFDIAALKTSMNIPEEWEPLVIIPIGKPATDTAIPEKKRKNNEEIIQWGKF